MTIFGIYLTTQQLGLICILVTVTLGVVLVKNSVLEELTSFTPFELSKVNRVTSKFNSRRETSLAVAQKGNRVKKLSEVFLKIRIFPFGEGTRDEYVDLIDRLNLQDDNGYKRVPEEFYVQSCLNVFGVIGGAIVLVLFSRISGYGVLEGIGFCTLVTIPLVFKLPLEKLRSLKKNNLIEIDKDMPEFISMFYYRFSNQSINFDLSDLIDSFLPLANSDTHRMLVRFQLDINGLGDASAIEILNKKYGDSTYVTSFCNIALGILEKRPNAYVQLEGLFERLNTFNRLRYKKMCEKKHLKKRNAYKIIMGIFCIELAVFIIFGIVMV